jgi:hypothetical protein
MRAALQSIQEKVVRTADPICIVLASLFDDRIDQNEGGEESGHLERSQGAALRVSQIVRRR